MTTDLYRLYIKKYREVNGEFCQLTESHVYGLFSSAYDELEEFGTANCIPGGNMDIVFMVIEDISNDVIYGYNRHYRVCSIKKYSLNYIGKV